MFSSFLEYLILRTSLYVQLTSREISLLFELYTCKKHIMIPVSNLLQETAYVIA